MYHIYLIRLVVLKRPSFQSKKYGMPSLNASTLVNIDIGREAPKKHYGHPVCHHPITCCQTPELNMLTIALR